MREIHHMDRDREIIETTVNQYRVRLADQNRSAENPSGVLVGEYSEKQVPPLGLKSSVGMTTLTRSEGLGRDDRAMKPH